MNPPAAQFYFDFLDPLSYLVGRELDELDSDSFTPVVWIGLELRPYPTPLANLDDPDLAQRWARAAPLADAFGISFAPPNLAPWTRKAHELVMHAAGHDADGAVRNGVFEAYLLRGLDIGRVDVLVQVAHDAGLETTEAKAVLDVDRYEAAVVDAAGVGAALGIDDVPTIVRESRRLEGFHNHAALGTFLRR